MARGNWRGTAAVIAALTLAAASIVAQAATRPAPGIYLQEPGKNSDNGLVRLHGLLVTRTKAKGLLATMMTQGMVKGSVVATIDGSSAEVRAPAGDVVFDVFFDTKPAPKPGDMPTIDPEEAMQMVSGDFMPPGLDSGTQIILLHMKPKKDEREVELAKGTGRSRDEVPIAVESIGDHAFRVRPKGSLAPGEYAFTFTARGARSGGGQLWDFGVDNK